MGPIRASGSTQPLYRAPGFVNSPSRLFHVLLGWSSMPLRRLTSTTVGMASPEWQVGGPKTAKDSKLEDARRRPRSFLSRARPALRLAGNQNQPPPPPGGGGHHRAPGGASWGGGAGRAPLLPL